MYNKTIFILYFDEKTTQIELQGVIPCPFEAEDKIDLLHGIDTVIKTVNIINKSISIVDFQGKAYMLTQYSIYLKD